MKLATSAGHLQALKLALENAGANSAPEASLLSRTYYDSADLKLRRHDLSLCVEEQDERRVQAVQGNGGGRGNSALRGEWRDPIAGDGPDPAAPETGPLLREVVAADELRPLFKTQVRRTSFTVEPDPSVEIAAALDEGEIETAAGDVAEPVCELELELKRGDPAALYDMALRLLDVAPVRIETRSQPERGYRLAGAEIAAVGPQRLALDPTMTVEAVLQSMGRDCLGHLLRNEPAALAGDAEGFHQMRVALRRLRSALSSVRSMLPEAQYRWATDELKWLADSLGPARNWDVFAASLLAPVRSALPGDAELKRLAETAKRRRRAAHDGAKEAIRSRRYAASTLKLARWFESRGWRDQKASERAAPLFAPISDVAPLLLDRRWRQVRKRSRRFAKLSQDERHALRIALKKLRYMIEAFGGLYDPRAVKAVTRRLKPLQEELGHLNDVCTAQALMKEIGRPAGDSASELGRDAGLVLGWHLRGLADQEKALRRNVRRLRRAEPFWGKVPPAPSDAAAGGATATIA